MAVSGWQLMFTADSTSGVSDKAQGINEKHYIGNMNGMCMLPCPDKIPGLAAIIVSGDGLLSLRRGFCIK